MFIYPAKFEFSQSLCHFFPADVLWSILVPQEPRN